MKVGKKRYRLSGQPGFAMVGYPIVIEVNALSNNRGDLESFMDDLCIELAAVALSNKRQSLFNVQVNGVTISHGKDPAVRDNVLRGEG